MAWKNLGGLLSLIGIGGLFHWMTKKGGHGARSGHSHGEGHRRESGEISGGTGHSGHEAHEREPGRDPVCGMQVDPELAAGTRTTSGNTFYLCSSACLEKFDRDPERYARRAIDPDPGTGEGRERSHRHGCC